MKVDYLKSLLLNAGDEPDRVQQLRKLIVTLAVSGKLGSNKRSHALPRVSPDALPVLFEGTSGFTVLNAVARIEKGRTGIKQAVPGPYPLVVTAAERSLCDHFDFEGPAAIVPLVSSTGHGKASLHRLHYQDGNFALGTILAAIFPFDEELISARFLFEYLSAFKEELLVSRMIGTANVSLSVGKIAEIPVPLVSLDVQTKVGELMALCDQLEAARTEREALRDRLGVASLARLNAPDPETFFADARFALEALPSLTDRADQIKQLRRTIINLAVCGRLVPQQPDDEPAVALLERFSKAKLRRRDETNDARIKVARDPASDELGMDLPSGWAVQSFENLFLFIDYRGNTPPKTPHGVPLITAKNIRKGFLDREPREFISETTFKTWMTRGLPKIGDLFFTTEAPLANACVNELDEPFALAQRIICLQPYSDINTRFLMLAILSDVMQKLIEKHATGMTAKGIKSANLKPLPIPVPPIAEQNRITEKVDELMALCDQLEASLANADNTRCRLLDALLHEALAPVAKPSKEYARAAVSGYLVSRLASKRSFGRTAHMKHLYFAESLLGLDLGGCYVREVAGPLDTGIYELEKRAEAAGWYTHCVETLPSGKEKVSYQPGKGLNAIAGEGLAVLGRSRAEMDRLIDLMGGLKTECVEIIATLFAAWNDALLDGKTPDDNWIIKEVREHWHVSKQRFSPEDLTKWLGWMRQNDVVPHGHPPRTMQQTMMEF